MVYKYRGLDKKTGKTVSGKLEATSLEDIKLKLKSKNILAQKISESKESFFVKLEFLRQSKISNTELANFSNNLAIYIKSGVALINAIKLSKHSTKIIKNCYIF